LVVILPGWPPRDWRKLLAMFLLSGGGMAITVVVWRLVTLVAERSVGDPWPLAYSLYGALGLLGLVLVSLGWTLGKSTVSGTMGAASFSASGGDGGDDPVGAPTVTTTTKTEVVP
jgi:hypothetical protein